MVDDDGPDFDPNAEVELTMEQDSDWAGSREDRRSTSGYRGEIRGFRIMHAAQTQPGLPSLSSAEAELRSLTRTSTEALYIQKVAAELGLKLRILIHGDASAAYRSAERLGPGRIKHLETNAFFIKEAVRKKLLSVKKIPRADNRGDALTHHLPPPEFKKRYEAAGYVRVGDLAPYLLLEQEKINTFEMLKPWNQPPRAIELPILSAHDVVSLDVRDDKE